MPKNKKLKLNKKIAAVYNILDNEWFLYSIRSIYNYVNYILIPNKIEFPDPLNKIKVYELGVKHAINAIQPNYVMYLDPEDVWPEISLKNLIKLMKVAPHITEFEFQKFSFYKLWNYSILNVVKKVDRWPCGDCHFKHQSEIYFHNYRYLIENIEDKIDYLKKIEGCNKLRKDWIDKIWNKFKQNPALITSKGLHPFDKDLFKSYVVYKGEWPGVIAEHRFFKDHLKN